MKLQRDNIDFARNLTKGKIVETIFWMMFRDNKDFSVLPFGYERLIPEIATLRQKLSIGIQTAEQISQNPDFVLISNDKTKIIPVDVKFRADIYKRYRDIKSKAKKTLEAWKECWYFVATPTNFYFESCKDILEGNKLKSLSEKLVNYNSQQEYLSLLKEFMQIRVLTDATGNNIFVCKCTNCGTTISYNVKNNCPSCHMNIFGDIKKNPWVEKCKNCLKPFPSVSFDDSDCPYCGYDNS